MKRRFDGQVALVTGASTGIGAEFARQLAAAGANIMAVARSADKLDALASEIRSREGVAVTPIAMDLSAPNSPEALYAALRKKQLDVDIVVNNAGVGYHGDVLGADPERMRAQIDLNVNAVVGITMRFLPAMVERGHGAILNISSVGAFQPVPHMAVYGASKAFVLSFSEAVWAEVAALGVHVLAVIPGDTETPFFESAGGGDFVGKRRSVEQVVGTAIRAMSGRKASVIDGRMNAFVSRFVTRMLPERVLIAAAERTTHVD